MYAGQRDQEIIEFIKTVEFLELVQCLLLSLSLLTTMISFFFEMMKGLA